MSDVTLPGVPSNALPGVYVNLTIPGAASGTLTAQYVVLILGNPLAGTPAASATAGTVYGPDTLVPLNTLSDMQSLAGFGSSPSLMFSAFRLENQTTPVYFAPVAQATGAFATQTVTITAAGGSSQTTGEIQYTVDGFIPLQTTFASTDSATTIATNLAQAINNNINLPVTAAASTNTVVVTSKVKNQRMNFLRGFAQVVAGSGVTVTPATPTFFANGSGSDAAGYLSTLNAIASTNNRYYYLLPEAGFDSVDGYNAVAGNFSNGAVAAIQSFIDTQAQPANGNRQRAIFGSNDTLGNSALTAYNVNDVRLEAAWLPNSDLLPCQLAANMAAAVTNFETVPLAASGISFDNFGAEPSSVNFWSVPAPLDGSAPSKSNQQSAINSGLTPLKVLGNSGKTCIVKRCTSYFYFPADPGTGVSSALRDFRATDAGQITVCDRFFDDLSNLIQVRFARNLIGADPAQGSPPAAPFVCTPDNLEDVVLQVINQYAAANLVNGPQTIQTLLVQQNANPPTAMGVVVGLFVSNLLHQVLIQGTGMPALVV